MRSLTENVGPAPEVPQGTGQPWLTLNIELITPLYGGGAKVGENDLERPVRVSSIRGALRFWWRATRGSACSSAKELYEKESTIWGSTECASAVRLAVAKLSDNWGNTVKRAKTYGFTGKKKGEDYALFSACSRNDVLRKEGASFQLIIDAPESLRCDVEAALWAWLNFGGLGARTRRGVGSLYCCNFAPPSSDAPAIERWFNEKRTDYGLDETNGMGIWSTLGSLWIGSAKDKALDAWDNSVDVMRILRQEEGVGRNKGQGITPGRSRWPEADTLRRFTKQHAPKHAPVMQEVGYPRAAFGLPIVFHFKDNVKGDPGDTTLHPQGSERMASPVVLKALRCVDGKSCPAALFLDTPGVPPLELSPGGAVKNKDVINPEFANYHSSPMKGTSGSALEALKRVLKEKKFTEVKP